VGEDPMKIGKYNSDDGARQLFESFQRWIKPLVPRGWEVLHADEQQAWRLIAVDHATKVVSAYNDALIGALNGVVVQ
jgi:hypothetical protein